jgi:ribosomal-protein-alanine N-acetyltransferase
LILGRHFGDDLRMTLNLITKRLRLRPMVDADLDLNIEMFTDPEVVEFVCDLMTEDEIRAEMSNWTKRGGNGCIGIWCIADRHSNEKYGSVFLLPMPVDEGDTDYSLVVPNRMPDAEIEIGFELKRSAWGKGYATEACKRLIQFAFEDTQLIEVVATFYEENVASRKVLEKSGLTDRGRMRCYGEDCPNYRISRNEWNKLQHLD